MNPTLYDILGVAPDASREQIRQAWREAADRFEPGQGSSTKQFRLFNEAAEVLLDPERRAEYDSGLAESGTPTVVAPAAASSPASPPWTEPPTRSRRPLGVLRKSPGTSSEASDPSTDATPGAAATAAGPGSGSTDAEAGPPSGGVHWVVLAVLGVLVALAVGVAAYFTVQAERVEAYQQAVARAPSAAENAAVAVLSYDYESLEADRDAAAKFLSPDYRTEYVDTFDKLVVESATETKAKVEAEVLASSAMASGGDRDPERVQVLLFVNQSTTNAATEQTPSVALNRVRFDMVEVGGTWLVDGITSY